MKDYYIGKLTKTICANRQTLKNLQRIGLRHTELVMYIYCIEYMHRNSFILNFFETLMIQYTPNYCVRNNFSLGPFQIQYSFCEKYDFSYVALEDLLDLYKSSLIVDDFVEKHKFLSINEILNLYHAGDKNDNSYSSFMYSTLFTDFLEIYPSLL